MKTMWRIVDGGRCGQSASEYAACGSLAQTPADQRARDIQSPPAVVADRVRSRGIQWLGSEFQRNDLCRCRIGDVLRCIASVPGSKSYTFKIHIPGDANRTLGDSVYQYKFNRGWELQRVVSRSAESGAERGGQQQLGPPHDAAVLVRNARDRVLRPDHPSHGQPDPHQCGVHHVRHR